MTYEDALAWVIERKADNAEFIAEELLTLLRAKTEPHEAAARNWNARVAELEGALRSIRDDIRSAPLLATILEQVDAALDADL